MIGGLGFIEQRLNDLARTVASLAATVAGLQQANWSTAATGLDPNLASGNVHCVAIVTAQITAMSGTAPGYGTAKLQQFDGTNLSDYSPTTTFTVYSISEKIIAVGAYINCDMRLGCWWVSVVDKCGNLS